MVLPRSFSNLSIRIKLIAIVAGTLLLAQLASGLFIRDLVSKHIVQQAITTVDILTTSILRDITYESQRDSESGGQTIIAKYMTYHGIISDMEIYVARCETIASSDASRLHQRTSDPEVLAAVRNAKPSLHVSRPGIENLGIRSVAPCTSELHQVWTNLITNASEAIAERTDGVEGEVRITTRRAGTFVAVTVSDNGVGIPAEIRDRIFDPFFTTKDIGKGTGLGLCIVSGIIKRQGGTIRVDSAPGRTAFEIMIPIAPAAGNESGGAVDAAMGAVQAPGDEERAA